MAQLHVPNIEAIDAVEDWGVRLYAIIGANMTFASTLELALFRLYQEASSQSTEDAARKFYKEVKFTYKRNLVDAAVKSALKGHKFLEHWSPILNTLQVVAGPLADRNLVGHNPIEDELKIVPNLETGDADVYQRYFVRQNPVQVQIGNRQAQETGYETLRAYAIKQYACLWEVRDFTARVLAALGRYRPAEDLGPEPVHLGNQPKGPKQQ